VPGHGPDGKKKTDVFLPSESEVLSGTLGVGQKRGWEPPICPKSDRGLPHFFQEIQAPNPEFQGPGKGARGVSPGGWDFGPATPVLGKIGHLGGFWVKYWGLGVVWGWSWETLEMGNLASI